eukprot:COSAG01_NODE_10967_length_2037_cov_7.679567_1_plen_176_part_00
MYLAVTNGGSTLEGYYKTKFGLLRWEDTTAADEDDLRFTTFLASCMMAEAVVAVMNHPDMLGGMLYLGPDGTYQSLAYRRPTARWEHRRGKIFIVSDPDWPERSNLDLVRYIAEVYTDSSLQATELRADCTNIGYREIQDMHLAERYVAVVDSTLPVSTPTSSLTLQGPQAGSAY